MSQLSFILLILIYLNWWSCSFSQYHFFPNFDGPNAFPLNSTGPWSRLQNGRKIPDIQNIIIHTVPLIYVLYDRLLVAGDGNINNHSNFGS